MTTEVGTVGPDASLKEVARTLVQRGISGMPVVSDAGEVLGVISEADLLAKEADEHPEGEGVLGRLLARKPSTACKYTAQVASEAMTAPAITTTPDRQVADAAATMLEKRVNRLPVLGARGQLVGIVTRADLVRAFARDDDDLARRTGLAGAASQWRRRARGRAGHARDRRVSSADLRSSAARLDHAANSARSRLLR